MWAVTASTTQLPKVSVLVPTHNYERYIEQSVQSALDQDYPPDRLEVVVVDDGSTDRSGELIQRMVDRNPGRIRFVTQENRGQIGTIDRARREATGELVAFLDADDVWLPDKTRKQVAAFQAEPGVGLVFCDMTTIDEHGRTLKTTVFDPGEPRLDPVWLHARVLRTNIIYGGCTMYRADLLQDPPDTLESWDWWLAVEITARFAAGELRIGFVPESLALYRQHGENMLLGADGTKLVNLRRRQLRFQLWALRRVVSLDVLGPQELVDVWRGPEWFAQTAAEASGSYFVELVTITDAEREEADRLRVRAEQAAGSGDAEGAVRLMFRALAWNPYEPEAVLRFYELAQLAYASAAGSPRR
jgi:hypothetical protein